MRTPEISLLLDKAYCRLINIRAKNVTKSHSESRTRTQTAESDISEDDAVEELWLLHAEADNSADNNAIYIAEPGFIVMQAAGS